MDWLNYHHLLYFWTVAREGSISKATHTLGLAQPTISAQIRNLEDSLQEKLFQKSGRRLELTEVGRMVFRYADEIFSIGRELKQVLRGRPTGRPIRFSVGIVDVVPKLVAYRLLLPVLQLRENIQLVVHEGSPSRLLAELSVHQLDLVIADSPASQVARVRAFSHVLGESNVAFYGSKKFLTLRKGFPKSMKGAPLLLPPSGSFMRLEVEKWLDQHEIEPQVIGEFEDSALMKVFGQRGTGLFPGLTSIETEMAKTHRVYRVGDLGSSQEKFYAISMDRKLKHPAVLAILETARKEVFRNSRTFPLESTPA